MALRQVNNVVSFYIAPESFQNDSEKIYQDGNQNPYPVLITTIEKVDTNDRKLLT